MATWVVLASVLIITCAAVTDSGFRDQDGRQREEFEREAAEEEHLGWESGMKGITEPSDERVGQYNGDGITQGDTSVVSVTEEQGRPGRGDDSVELYRQVVSSVKPEGIEEMTSDTDKNVNKQENVETEPTGTKHIREEDGSNEREERYGRSVSVRSEDEVEVACECVRTPQTQRCQQKMENFGPIIIRGECYNDGVTHRGRRSANREESMGSPLFIVNHSQHDDTHTVCAGDKPLILLSSGHKSNISLTGVPAVLVCPGSLAPYLQHLAITEVPQVKLGKGALQPRHTHFTFSVSGGGKGSRLVVPEDGLKVDTGEVREYGSELSGVIMEAEEAEPTTPPMEVKVEIRNVSEVRFEERSLVAPRVSVMMEGVTEAALAPHAIIPYTNPEMSSLQVLSTGRITFNNESVTIGMLNITNVNKLEIHEGAIEIFNFGDVGEGGIVHIKEVLEATLGEGAITFPRGGSLFMQSVLVSRAGRRAVTAGTSSPHFPSPLLNRVTLQHVVFENSEPVAFCLPATYATLSDLVVLRGVGGEGVRKALCVSAAKDLHAATLRDVTEDSAVASAVVVCVSQHLRPDICPDPRCHLCRHNIPPATPAPTLTPDTNTNTTADVLTPELQEVTVLPTTISISTSIITRAPRDEEDSWTAHLSPYALALLLVAILAALALLTLCVYKIHRRGKQAEYKVPRTLARPTFPRTIITRDILAASQLDQPRPDPPEPSQMYVSFTVAAPPCPTDTRSLQASFTSEEASMASHESFPAQHSAISYPLRHQGLPGTEELLADQSSFLASSQDLPPYCYITPDPY